MIRGQQLQAIDAQLTESTVSTDRVFEGSFLKIDRAQVRLPNDQITSREFIRHSGASAIVVLDEQGRVVLERQWRTPMGSAIWEIPAGKIDSGETPFEAARRELLEEAGMQSDDWVELGTIHNAIAYSDEKIVIYLARNACAVSGQQLDANEFLTIVPVSLADYEAAVRDGTITDVKTVIALYWTKDYLAGNLPQAKVCAD